MLDWHYGSLVQKGRVPMRSIAPGMLLYVLEPEWWMNTQALCVCCRELTSFVFIFESANRIVVEKPNYGHATYFFDLEEPLPVADQVLLNTYVDVSTA